MQGSADSSEPVRDVEVECGRARKRLGFAASPEAGANLAEAVPALRRKDTPTVSINNRDCLDTETRARVAKIQQPSPRRKKRPDKSDRIQVKSKYPQLDLLTQRR